MTQRPDTTKILFRALVSMQGEILENGELLLADGKVQSLSRTRTQTGADTTLDLSDHLILPGFVNAHCHLALSALQGRVPYKEKFTDWVRELVPLNAGLALAERVDSLHRASGTLLRSGVTALGDYLAEPQLLEEYVRLPFRKMIFLEVLGFKRELADSLSEGVERVLSATRTDDLLKLGIAPHAPYTVSPLLFQKLHALSKQYDVPFSCHVAEFPEELRFLKDGGGDMCTLHQDLGSCDAAWQAPGGSPLVYLDSLEVLEFMTAVHLNHIDGEADLLRARTMRAVFCPGSTRWFGRKQWMPVRELLDRGVSVALGTDSLASNESLNFLRELKIAEEMLPAVSRMELLAMATRGGAEALGMEAGRIAPGRPADFVGFRLDKAPVSWADIPFARDVVDFLMIAGQTILGEP